MTPTSPAACVKQAPMPRSHTHTLTPSRAGRGGQNTAAYRMQTIYDLHSAALLRTLLQWTYGDWQAAEDLMQETMVRAWRHLDTLNTDPQTLRPWLFTVARRIAIDRFRARVVRPPETEPESLEEAVEPGEPYELLLDRATVVGALRELSEVHRTALIQVYLMDRTVPEAAAALGVPEGTVKSRLHHGLRAVRAVVGCSGPDCTASNCRGACS